MAGIQNIQDFQILINETYKKLIYVENDAYEFVSKVYYCLYVKKFKFDDLYYLNEKLKIITIVAKTNNVKLLDFINLIAITNKIEKLETAQIINYEIMKIYNEYPDDIQLMFNIIGKYEFNEKFDLNDNLRLSENLIKYIKFINEINNKNELIKNRLLMEEFKNEKINMFKTIFRLILMKNNNENEKLINKMNELTTHLNNNEFIDYYRANDINNKYNIIFNKLYNIYNINKYCKYLDFVLMIHDKQKFNFNFEQFEEFERVFKYRNHYFNKENEALLKKNRENLRNLKTLFDIMKTENLKINTIEIENLEFDDFK